MRPPGAIALPGGNACAAQCCHSQNAFLTAAAQGTPQYRHRPQGAVIGGGVGGVGVAPVIHRKGSLLQGFTLHMGQQRLHQKAPAAIQTFGIDPVIQHIGQEDFRRDSPAIIDAVPGLQGGFHIPGKHLHREGQHILRSHMAVEIPQAEGKACILIRQKSLHFFLCCGIAGYIIIVLLRNRSLFLGCHGKFHGRLILSK